MPRDDATLIDIALACRRVIDFTDGYDRDGFLADEKTQSAVVHQLLTVGEAVKRLSGDFRAAHASIPWSDIARMRDRLVHHYDAVDLETVWKTVETDVPDLLRYVEPLLPPES